MPTLLFNPNLRPLRTITSAVAGFFRPANYPTGLPIYACAGNPYGIDPRNIPVRCHSEIISNSVSVKARAADMIDPALIEKQNTLIDKIVDLTGLKKWQKVLIGISYIIPPVGLLLHVGMLFYRGTLQSRYLKALTLNDPEFRSAFIIALQDRKEAFQKLSTMFEPEKRAQVAELVKAAIFIQKYHEAKLGPDLIANINQVEEYILTVAFGSINRHTAIYHSIERIKEELKGKLDEYFTGTIVPLRTRSYTDEELNDAINNEATNNPAINNLGKLINALQRFDLSAEYLPEIKAAAEKHASDLKMIVYGNLRDPKARDPYLLIPYRIDPKPSRYKKGAHKQAQSIGIGGSGEVYKAWDMMNRRSCAVKIFLADLNTTAFLRANREIEILKAISKIDDPHLMKLFDFGSNETLFTVLPLMENLTLQDLIEENRKRGKPFSPLEAAEYAQKILEGLQVMHTEGLAHRDIKPGNIFVVEGANQKKVILTDFDIGKSMRGKHLSPASQNITKGYETSAPIIGTRRLLAPEFPKMSALERLGRLHSAAIENWLIKNDIYAVGCTLYMMLTNNIDPFKMGNNADEIEKNYLLYAAGERTVKLKRGNIPRPLFEIIEKAVAYNPNERYSSTEQFIEDLGKFLIR